MDDDFFINMIIYVLIFMAIFTVVRILTNRKKASSAVTTSTSKPKTSSRDKMAEDIKATKTSQVSDAVSILEDLGSTSSNYRHYCELVGTSMASGGVTAPYSRRQVAYYDIKCYRLDATRSGGQEETLVAHERSFDPFFFTDASCDTPIYIDLESFGNNVILVNSTNHVEGPNSDFAAAFKKNATTATSSGAGNAFAMVSHIASRGANTLLGAARAISDALAPQPVLQPACALAGGGTLGSDTERATLGSNMMFSRGGGQGGSSGRGVTSGRRSSGGGKPSDKGQIYVGFGTFGNRPPQHMGDFMGGYGGGPWVMGGGYGNPRPINSPSSTEVLLGMGLGALLSSMTSSQQQAAQSYTTPTDTFRGYRLVENVVPLGSPVYCIGEIYHAGTDIYMGRSLAKDYPTSYFATKPESEVLSAIGSK